MLTIDEFIMKVFPPPAEDHKDYSFYHAWGYEQWLIKTQKYDLEQMRLLLNNDYNKYRLTEILTGDIEENLKQFRLVKAKKILDGFLMQSVAKGWFGLALWEENGGWFCIFPSVGGAFGQLMRVFSSEEVELTEEYFSTSEDYLGRSDIRAIRYPYQLEKHLVNIPGRGVYWVERCRSQDCGHNSVEFWCSPATKNEKGKWVYSKAKKSLDFIYNIEYNVLSDCEILD